MFILIKRNHLSLAKAITLLSLKKYEDKINVVCILHDMFDAQRCCMIRVSNSQ